MRSLLERLFVPELLSGQLFPLPQSSMLLSTGLSPSSNTATGRLTADPGCGLTTLLCHAVQPDWRTAGLSPPTPPELDFPAVDRSGRMKEACLISFEVTSREWNKIGNLSHPSRTEPSLPRASGVCVRRTCAHVEPSAKDPNDPLICPWSRLTSVASSTLEGPFPP